MAEVHTLRAEPHNSDAEAAVLGAILRDNTLLERLQGSLRPTDFFEPLHKELYEATIKLAEEGRRADLTTLVLLVRGKKIGDADAEDYLRALPDMAPDPGPGGLEALFDYVREITRFSAHRGVIRTSRDLGTKAADPYGNLMDAWGSASTAFDEALSRMQARAITTRRIDEFATMALDAYDKATIGISTGLRDLDSLIGGLLPGELTIIGGRPSQGKTTLATAIALNVASEEHGVAFLSMEMSGIPVAQRVLSSLCYRNDKDCIPYNKFRHRSLDSDDIRRLSNARDQLTRMPLIVEERGGMNVAEITAAVRRIQLMLESKGEKLDLIVLDYLGLVQHSARWGDNRAYAIGETTMALRDLGKRVGAHTILLHQLNRDVEKGTEKRPQMHHLRESGSIEQDADMIMFTYRDEYYIEREPDSKDELVLADKKRRQEEARNVMEIIVQKNRMGEVGTKKAFCSIGSNRVTDLD